MEETMIKRDDWMLFIAGGLLFFLLIPVLYLIFFVEAELSLEKTTDIGAVLAIFLVVALYGAMIDGYFARKRYLGKVLETDQITNGEHSCRRINSSLFWIMSQKDARIFQV